MEDLQKSINEQIEKNLPQQVGELLKKRLEKADEDEKDLENLKKTLEQKLQLLSEYSLKDNEISKLNERERSLELREKEISKKENNFEISKLQYELANEKEKTQFSQNVAMGLVRNTNYRQDVFGNQPMLRKDSYNGNEMIENVSTHQSKTLVQD